MYILRHPDGDPSGKMMFQNAYVWLVFVAALDIMFTWVVLWYGGYEANGLAAVMIHTYGPTGLVVYKYLLILFVIVLCEVVTRRNRRAGRFLIGAAIILTCVPVLVALALRMGQKHDIADVVDRPSQPPKVHTASMR